MNSDPVEAMRLRAEDAIAARLQVEAELEREREDSALFLQSLANRDADVDRLETDLAAARSQVAALREANRNLLEVAKTFVYGYWTTVHIGEKLNQLRIHISDEQLDQFRTIITAALAAVVSAPTTGQSAAGEGE